MSISDSALSSRADVWHLKQTVFASRPVKIITQNFNGPCSFIAICNILVLRGLIEILPHDRTTVSYEFLSQLVGEYLLTNCPDVDISAALSIMPSTTKGLDLNPQFTSITAFSPASGAGELDLFAQAGIQLVHGWLVDPDSPEAAVMAHIRDYDTAVTLIADADYITQGRLLGRDHSDDPHDQPGPSAATASSSRPPTRDAFSVHDGTTHYTDDQRLKIEQAIVAQQFLDATKSQLTYHGLFQLASTLEPGSLVALFRNAHLSVVYKSPGPDLASRPDPDTTATAHADGNSDPSSHLSPDPGTIDVTAAPTPTPVNTESARPSNSATPDTALYALVTDDVFLHEPSIVWERLEDVDGGWSTFVDADFCRAVPVGGDVAGQTAEAALRGMEMPDVDPADQELARRLQAEEDERAHEVYRQRQEALERRRVEEAEGERRRGRRWRPKAGGSAVKGKKGKECVVM